MAKKKYNPNDSIWAMGLDHELKYGIDENGDEILVKSTNSGDEQVMMEWEIPYMKALIEELNPKGDVLEIGFGLGYSATFIQEHKPKSHTIIECHPTVIKEAKVWAKDYPDSDIRIIEGPWQDTLETLGVFDEIFLDDHGLDIKKKDKYDGTYKSYMLPYLMKENHYIFFDMVLNHHMKKGSKLTYYQNSPWEKYGYAGQFNHSKNAKEYWRSNYESPRYYSQIVNNPLTEYWEKIISLPNPASPTCNYFFGPEAIIAMTTKIYDDENEIINEQNELNGE
jgi:predicted O-methyltransferase YrrM